MLAGCVYGFGQVITSAACIAPIQNAILTLNLNPYITAMVSVAIIAGLCTDGISAMMVWLPMFGQQYLDMGVNAGALRRLLLCTTQTFDSLPPCPVHRQHPGRVRSDPQAGLQRSCLSPPSSSPRSSPFSAASAASSSTACKRIHPISLPPTPAEGAACAQAALPFFSEKPLQFPLCLC